MTTYITSGAIGTLPDRLAILVALATWTLYSSQLSTAPRIVLIAVILLQGGFSLAHAGPANLLTWSVVDTKVASGAAYV